MLTESQLRAMFPNASNDVIRASLTPPTPGTPARKPDLPAIKNEVKELHVPFAKWLRDYAIPYVTARSDKASGISVGWPDFSVFYKGAVFVEFKRLGEKLRPSQAECHERLRMAGMRVITAFSVEEAIQFVRAELLTITRTELLPKEERRVYLCPVCSNTANDFNPCSDPANCGKEGW